VWRLIRRKEVHLHPDVIGWRFFLWA